MDYNSIPFRNRDIEVITKTKETPNRTVKKKIFTEGDSKAVVKEVENRRGSKRIVKVDGLRTANKTYGKKAEIGTGLEYEPKVTRGHMHRFLK